MGPQVGQATLLENICPAVLGSLPRTFTWARSDSDSGHQSASGHGVGGREHARHTLEGQFGAGKVPLELVQEAINIHNIHRTQRIFASQRASKVSGRVCFMNYLSSWARALTWTAAFRRPSEPGARKGWCSEANRWICRAGPIYQRR